MRLIVSLVSIGTAIILPTSALCQETWVKIDNNRFSFVVPAYLKKTNSHGIDSFVEDYEAAGIRLGFDFGIHSGKFAEWPKETKYEELKINGKAATIGTVGRTAAKPPVWHTGVYFKLDGQLALMMAAECESQKEVAVARKIFESITFKTKGG